MIFERIFNFSEEIINHLRKYPDAYTIYFSDSRAIPNEFIVYNIYNHKKYIGFIILYNDEEQDYEINDYELILGIFKKYQNCGYLKNVITKFITKHPSLTPPFVLGAIIAVSNKRKPYIFNSLHNLGFQNKALDGNAKYELEYLVNL